MIKKKYIYKKNIKKYIQYSEFRAHSVFQGKHKLLKSPER